MLPNLTESEWEIIEPEMLDMHRNKVFVDGIVTNWGLRCMAMFPLVTKGDGNCLLHGVSLAICGVLDQCGNVRNRLVDTLLDDEVAAFIRDKWVEKGRSICNIKAKSKKTQSNH